MPDLQGISAHSVGETYATTFGTPTIVASPLYQGRQNSLSIDSPGNEGYRKTISGSPSRGYMGFPFTIPANPAGGALTLAAMHSVTSNIQCRLTVNTSGQMRAFIGGGTDVGGPTLTPNQFYWVDMIYKVVNATHELLWWVDGAAQSTPTVAATGSDSVDYGQLVSLTGGGTVTWTAGGFWAWGSSELDTDILGPPSAVNWRAYQRLVGPRLLGTTAHTPYIVPPGYRTTIRRIWVNNPSGSQAGFTLSIGSDASATRLWDGDNVAAGGEINHNGDHALAAGDFIQAYSDTSSTLVLVIDGYEESA